MCVCLARKDAICDGEEQKTTAEQISAEKFEGEDRRWKNGGGRTGRRRTSGGTLDGADRRLMSAGMTGLKTSLSLSLSLDVSCGSWLALC